MIRALLFDLDGTLLDTNEAHVRTWQEAFRTQGFWVGRERIEREIGRGGDLLVREVLGEDVERTCGDQLRRAKAVAFRASIAWTKPTLEPGALEALSAARRAGLKTAVATSSSAKDVRFLERRLGLRLLDYVDVVSTLSGEDTSKPEPDVIEKACSELALHPLHCAMVGDSVFDVESARKAGVAGVGVTTGYASKSQLEHCGARAVIPNMSVLGNELTSILARCDSTRMNFDRESTERLMDAALAAARVGMEQGEVPIGAALFSADGNLLVAGYNTALRTGDVTMHAEMCAFHQIAEAGKKLPPGTILASTLEPCVMCLGAAMEAGVDVVLYGLPAPADGGVCRLRAPESPENLSCRVRGGILAKEARELFVSWRKHIATPEQLPYVEQLLARTVRATSESESLSA